jgi:hypothetical protein
MIGTGRVVGNCSKTTEKAVAVVVVVVVVVCVRGMTMAKRKEWETTSLGKVKGEIGRLN